MDRQSRAGVKGFKNNDETGVHVSQRVYPTIHVKSRPELRTKKPELSSSDESQVESVDGLTLVYQTNDSVQP